MRKDTKLALISVILFLFLFLVIDIILGQFLIPSNYAEFRIRDPRYHHGLKRNVSAVAAWGPIIYPFFTNNMAFRDASIRDVPLQAENKRILILGDSHSEGVGIEYKYTYAGMLHQKGADKGVEVLNASAVSYSPKIHYLKGDYLLNRLGLEVDEIWVVIDISDLQNEIAYANFEPGDPGIADRILAPLGRFFRNNSLTVHSLKSFRDNREYEAFSNTLTSVQKELEQLPTRNAIELYREFFRHFNDQALLRDPGFHGVGEWIYDESMRELADQGLTLGMQNISLLYKICREKGIVMRLSVHPWQVQVMKGDTSDYYVESWRSFCAREEIPFLNLYPLFINHENPMWVAKTCYIEGDNHWNEAGHARVADFLFQYVNQ